MQMQTIMTKYSFDEKNHVHKLGDKRMHGVTSILRMWGDPSALVNWAANQAVDYLYNLDNEPTQDQWNEARTAHLRKRDKAGDKGTEVHAELEIMVNDMIDGTLNGEYSGVTMDVYEWMLAEDIRPLASEMNVWSETHWFAGIADAVIEKDGKKYILDFKTSNSLQTKHFYQMGAYSIAVKEMKKEAKVDGVVIVHIPKGKSFKPEKNVYWRYDIEALEKAFLNILETYKTDKEVSKLVRY